nr:MAG TPA: hypothetical protein [Caudoviricetes sp.]
MNIDQLSTFSLVVLAYDVYTLLYDLTLASSYNPLVVNNLASDTTEYASLYK